MSTIWTILHVGALGDLVLTIQLALRVVGVQRARELHIFSRTDPGDLSACRPSIRRRSAEGLGLHWLFGDHDDPPPTPLGDALRGTNVLSALGGPHTITHQRLLELGAATVHSFDPQPHPGLQRHITLQWQSQLEAQGLLVPKCIHQHPAQRALGVPAELRAAGRELLRQAAGVADCVVLHPGSGGRTKCWPLSCFVDLGRRLEGESAGPVCFLVGPVEQERWGPARLAALAREFPLVRDPPPSDLVAMLAAARAYVGNDAGPTHLAALLGTRTVAIYGPTAAVVWQPLGPQVVVHQGDPGSATGGWGVAVGAVVLDLMPRAAAG